MKEIVVYKFQHDLLHKYIYPWEDVIECFDNKLDSHEFENRKSCPICNLESEKLFWIRFRSLPVTWRMFGGREGPLSICPDCKIQVEFLL